MSSILIQMEDFQQIGTYEMTKIRYEQPVIRSAQEIKNFIIKQDVHSVAKSMPAIGMQSEFDSKTLNLVCLCLQSNEEWIRRSGYICLYHFYFRYKSEMCTQEVINFWRNGLTDKSEVVASIVNDTLDEIKEFTPAIYEQITHE